MIMKTHVERINYYTKKVTEYVSIHHSKHRNPFRYNRLMTYKKLVHNQIELNKNKPLA